MMILSQDKYCKYGCGKIIRWVTDVTQPIEVDTQTEHSFNRCAEVQKSQGRRPFFFDRARREKIVKCG